MIQLFNGINALRQHVTDDVRIHGIITDGGTASNIVPERATGHFAVRAPHKDGLHLLKRRVEECFRAGALASGAEVAIEWEEIEYFDLIANTPLMQAYRANAETLGRRFREIDTLPQGQASSTDMGNVSHLAPTIHPMIAAVPQGVAFHTTDFAKWSGSEMGRRAMIDGAKAMAMTAVDVLQDETLRAAMAADFEAKVGG